MSKPITVYTAQPGSYLKFIDEHGLDNALDLSRPLQVVTFRAHAAMRDEMAAAVRERDAEIARLRALVESAYAEGRQVGMELEHNGGLPQHDVPFHKSEAHQSL